MVRGAPFEATPFGGLGPPVESLEYGYPTFFSVSVVYFSRGTLPQTSW